MKERLVLQSNRNIKLEEECFMKIPNTEEWVDHPEGVGGGGGTPLYDLYGYVPLDRVWFLAFFVLNRVYNLT